MFSFGYMARRRQFGERAWENHNIRSFDEPTFNPPSAFITHRHDFFGDIQAQDRAHWRPAASPEPSAHILAPPLYRHTGSTRVTDLLWCAALSRHRVTPLIS